MFSGSGARLRLRGSPFVTIRRRRSTVTVLSRRSSYETYLSAGCWNTFTDITREKLKKTHKYIREIKEKSKKMSIADLEGIYEKLSESYEVSSGFPNNRLVRPKRNELRRLRDLVGRRLDRKRQSQLPAPPQDPSIASGSPGTSERDGSGMEGSGEQDPSVGSGSPDTPLWDESDGHVEPQGPGGEDPSFNQSEEMQMTLYEKLIARIDNLERENSELKEANKSLIRRIERIERAPHETTSTGIAQPELDEVVKRIDSIEGKIVDLQNQVDEFRNPPPPECTPYQYWKRRAFEILGINDPADKPKDPWGCFDDDCYWRNKTTVTFKAYVEHLKKHSINIAGNPDEEYLPQLDI